MINSITIKDVATFNNAGITIDDLKVVNIIYGSNGTGKSTISKVIHVPASYPTCNIEWEDNNELQVITYNKDFCRKNYVEQMPGIFTLGEATNEALTLIAERQRNLDEVKQQGLSFKSEIEKQMQKRENMTHAFRESAWSNVFKVYEDFFPKTALKAGTKDGFMKTLLKTYNAFSVERTTLDDLKKSAVILFGNQPMTVQPLDEFSHDTIDEEEENVIWNTTIVGSEDVNIAGLIKALGNIDWVGQGIRYILDGNDVCPFCQQHTITSDFREQISEFFNDEYNRNISVVNQSATRYKSNTNAVINLMEVLVAQEKSKEKSFIDLEEYEAIIIAIKGVIASNIEKMAAKLREPSRSITLDCSADVIEAANDLIRKANAAIENHNALVANFGKEKDKLINDIWIFYVESYKTQIKEYIEGLGRVDKAITTLTKKIEDTRILYKRLDKEIKTLENNVTSVKPTINEINRLLEGFGFTNFSIQEVPTMANHYQIVRENGELAKDTLSEGESTFITFLYYMQLVKGSFTTAGVSSDRVLVIDDPVSSLDSNVLFVVSTLLRDVFTKIHGGESSIKQVFLLTHNVYFHKEVAFYDKHCTWRDCVHHWILRKNNNISSIQSYKKDNPIKSSYELLWNEYRNTNVTSFIVIQNIMRRIIENYFQVFGGFSPNAILDKFTIAEDKQICRSLLSWVNDGSHTLPEDLFVELSEDQLARYKEIFHKIFINMGQGPHYEMMMHMPIRE